MAGADPGLFLGGGALISCSTSTLINHIVFFSAEYQLYYKTAGHFRGGVHPLHPPPRSAPEWRLFPPVFSGGRTKGQEVMTSNIACHAMLWTENSNERPKTWDQQKHEIEISQNWLVWSGSPPMIVQNGWIFLIYEIYLEYGTAGHLVFWTPWLAVELKEVLSVTKHGFVFWAQSKPNTRLEIYKSISGSLDLP